MSDQNIAPHEGQTKSKRGFAALAPERRKEIARMGGKEAHKRGVAHVWNVEEARIAGKKGGHIKGPRKRNGE